MDITGSFFTSLFLCMLCKMDRKMKDKRILIIEDDKKICDLLRIYLEKEGYETVAAYDGNAGLEMFNGTNPDFIVLDLMLPGIDGNEVARKIRSGSNVPILMLTAKSEEIDKVLGLEIGADDYMTKPFSPKELVARVKAIFRRVDQKPLSETSPVVLIGDIEIDCEKLQVKLRGKSIHLSINEFKILHTLASHPGRVFSRDQLLSYVYKDENVIVLDRTVDAHIKNIRKKLKDDPRKPRYIESVFGAGYRFVEK
jgi:two-component system alkaline phosphatase synthesis response regulator PhoP